MSGGPQKTDSMEVLLLIGALAGLCILVAVAVTDLTMRTAQELGDLDTGETHAP